MGQELLSDDMRKDPLDEMVDGEDTPEFEDGSYLGGVVVHEELESEEGGYVKGQQLTTLCEGYLTKRTMPSIIWYVFKELL